MWRCSLRSRGLDGIRRSGAGRRAGRQGGATRFQGGRLGRGGGRGSLPNSGPSGLAGASGKASTLQGGQLGGGGGRTARRDGRAGRVEREGRRVAEAAGMASPAGRGASRQPALGSSGGHGLTCPPAGAIGDPGRTRTMGSRDGKPAALSLSGAVTEQCCH